MAIEAAQLLAIVTADTLGAEASLARVGRAFEAVGHKAEAGGIGGVNKFAFGVTAAAAVVGAYSVREAVQFQAAMAKVQGLTSASAGEMGYFKNSILSMSSEVGQKPKELADALYFIASGGLHGAKAMSVLKMSAMDAAAGLGSTHDIVQLLVGSVNAYAKSGLTAKTASDELVAAVTEGHMPANELARALGRVQGTTAALGISFPELLANLASLTKTTMSSSQAATSVQSVGTALIRMLNPSKAVAGALKDIGLSGRDVNIELRDKGLRATLQDLSDRTDRYSKAHGGLKDAIVKLFPNVRALRDILGTAGVQGKVYAEVLKKIEDATKGVGRTQEAFNVTQKTVAQEMQRVKAALSELAIRLGDLLLPAVMRVLNGFLGLVRFFETHHKTWLAVRDAFGVLIVGALALAARAMIGLLIAWAPAILTAAAIAAAVGLAVIGFKYLYDHVAAVRRIFNDFADTAKAVINEVFGTHMDLANRHSIGWYMTIEKVANGVKAVFRAVHDVVVGILNVVFGTHLALAEGHSIAWYMTIVRVGEGIKGVFAALRDALVRVFDWLRDILAAASRWFHDHRSQVEAVLKAIGQALVTIYQATVKFVMDQIHSIMKFASAWWKEHQRDVENTWTLIKGIIGLALLTIKAAFQVTWPYISKIIVTAWDIIKTVIGSTIKIVSDIIFAFVDLFTGHWKAAWDNAANAVVTALGLIGHVILDAVKLFGELLFQAGKDLIGGLINGIKSMAGAVGNAIKDVAQGAIDAAKSLFRQNSPSLVFHDIGLGVGEGLTNGIKASQKSVADAAAAMAKNATVAASGTFTLAAARRGGDMPGLAGGGAYMAQTVPYGMQQQPVVVNLHLDGASLQQAVQTGSRQVLTQVVREQRAGVR